MKPASIFSIRNKNDFEESALKIFRLQAEKNPTYKKYIEQLEIDTKKVKRTSQIPFLPIDFFKSHKVITTSNIKHQTSNIFISSGTTSENRSKHYVLNVQLYKKSFRKCFELFYGDVKQYAILALLPSCYENKSSSLIFMVNDLIKNASPESSPLEGTLNQNMQGAIQKLLSEKRKIILFGVSYALLDFLPLEKGGRGDLIVMETGGMKGRNTPLNPLSRGEIPREELHKILCEKFGVKKIHSEYGMTELLSQAYSKGDGIFHCPPWMKVLVRDVNDPFSFLSHEKTGALNIIDLANIHSCSFIATQDVSRTHRNGFFEVLGRMDNSDLRGCNLMVV